MTTTQLAIKKLITARFDAISSEAIPSPPSPAVDIKDEADGHSASEQSEDKPEGTPDSDLDGDGEAEIKVASQPPKKKQKRESSTDADARLAAELQAQEEALSGGRKTRGASTTKATKKSKPRAKAAKKKSAKRVRDDSDGEGSGTEEGEKPKRKGGGGFQKPFNLSSPLGDLCGVEQVCESCGDLCRGAGANWSLIAIPAAGRQKAMGPYQSQRAPRSERQATDSMRREDGSHLQGEQDRHVSDEQGYQQPPLPH